MESILIASIRVIKHLRLISETKSFLTKSTSSTAFEEGGIELYRSKDRIEKVMLEDREERGKYHKHKYKDNSQI